MVDGWNDFVEDNDLRRGDFLVFGYEGNFSFHVLIFDPTACEKEYQHFDSSQRDDNGDGDQACEVQEVEQSGFEAFKTSKAHKKDPKEIGKMENRKRRFEADATYLNNGNPYFIATLMPSYVKSKKLRIPVDFSRQHGLSSEKCPSIIIKDQSQRLWDVAISAKAKGSSTFYFGTGWHDFCVANHLKEGDSFMFELTKSGNNPTLKFHDTDDPKKIETRENKKRRTEANEASRDENPYFVATLMPSYFQNRLLVIPTNFLRLYDLHDKIWREVIIRDQKQRMWYVETKYETGSNHFYFSNGWHDFCVGNSLEEGDSFKFELTGMENMPTFNFYRLERNSMTNTGEFSEAEATSFEELDRRCEAKQEITPKAKKMSYRIGDPYFHGSISPSHLISHQVKLPRAFTRSNGLSDWNCNKMIKLRNNNGGTWQVYLGCSGDNGQGFLGRGWKDFYLENKLKVGDEYKFELVTEDDMFVFNYYGLKDSRMAKRVMGSKAKTCSLNGLETSCKVKKGSTAKTKNVSCKKGDKYFYGIISARHLSKNEMRFPKWFARSNGLNDRKCNEMIKLRIINGEVWQVVLGKQKWNDDQAYLTLGWIEFAMDNGLQVGDPFKLEVVNDKEDDMLILNFYGGSITKREIVSKAEATLSKPLETSFREEQKSTSKVNLSV